MLLSFLRFLGVKVVVFEHTHNVRNATTSIHGVVKRAMVEKNITKADCKDILYQLARIEKSLRYIRLLNKAQKDK